MIHFLPLVGLDTHTLYEGQRDDVHNLITLRCLPRSLPFTLQSHSSETNQSNSRVALHSVPCVMLRALYSFIECAMPAEKSALLLILLCANVFVVSFVEICRLGITKCRYIYACVLGFYDTDY